MVTPPSPLHYPEPLPTLPRLAVQARFATQGLVAGADIGGTHQTVALARLDGEVVGVYRRRLRPGGTATDVIANVFEMIDQALAAVRQEDPGGARHGGGKLLRVGVGFGGPVNQKAGLVLTSHHVPGWTNLPLRDEIERRLDAPAVVDNDANAAALGEALFGAGRGERDLLYVNLGTGIGAGIIHGGAIFHGKNGMAGEIGHVTVQLDGPVCACGKRGCLEALASGRSVGRRAREAAEADPAAGAALVALAGSRETIEAPHVIRAAAGGDPLSLRLVTETAEYLGLGLAGAANLLDPGMIVVGGGLADSGDLLFTPMRQTVRRHLLSTTPCPMIVPAALGYDAGIVGALALALDGL